MPTLKQLEDQARELAKKQLDLVNDESRGWPERKSEFDAIDVDLKDILDKHAALKAVHDFDALIGGTTEPVPAAQVPASPEVKSWGEQITASEAFKKAQEARGTKFTSGAIELKDFTIGSSGSPGGAFGGVIPQYLPGVTDILFRRLVVRDLFAQGVMTSPQLTYLKESAVTNAAAAVAEGGTKPESALTLVQVSEAAGKVATSLKASDEALEDVPFATSYINGRLRLFVMLAEEDQLLNGSGTAPNLTGIANRSGLATAQALGTDTVPDAIFKQMTNIRTTAFLDPDGIIMNPADWQILRLSKDSNDQYYGGGPFNGAYGNPGSGVLMEQIWGLRVVTTPAQAAGTAIVGAFQTAAQVFQRSPLRVEVTNSNEDDFLTNKIAFRAEERLGLAVYRPGAIGKVTGIV